MPWCDVARSIGCERDKGNGQKMELGAWSKDNIGKISDIGCISIRPHGGSEGVKTTLGVGGEGRATLGVEAMSPRAERMGQRR